MLNINDFQTTDFIQQSNNIYLHKDLSFDIPICRYIPIDYFVEILSTQKLYISNRKYLNDKREQGIKENLRDIFPLSPVYEDENMTREEAIRRYGLHQEAYSTCVSCWTKRTDESIMLWNCYGQNTCRLSTTIGGLINAIQPDLQMPTILVAPIQYVDNDGTNLIYEKVFSKNKAYQDEQEIRLCLLCNEHHFLLNIDTKVLIKDIILNPFFSKCYQNFLKDSIEERYKFLDGRINYSHLLEYKS